VAARQPLLQCRVAPCEPCITPEFQVGDWVLCSIPSVLAYPANRQIPSPGEFFRIDDLALRGHWWCVHLTLSLWRVVGSQSLYGLRATFQPSSGPCEASHDASLKRSDLVSPEHAPQLWQCCWLNHFSNLISSFFRRNRTLRRLSARKHSLWKCPRKPLGSEQPQPRQ
jgi:hypothetical protein